MVKQTLQEDLDRLTEAGIPVDIYFEQGLSALGMDNNVH
jgi:predicted DNA-binding transcriptional regulator YafY